MNELRARVARLAVTLPVRMFVAVVLLTLHVLALVEHAGERFDLPFNAAPGAAPAFKDPRVEGAPHNWQRLAVSRWDAQHYMALGLRGYSTCKSKEALGPGEYPDTDPTCELAFYPTYGFVGGWLAKLLNLPIDFALFGLSLAASFVFLLLWTGKEMRAGLGVGGCYLSLLLLNVFSTGFALVTVQTEPCLLALILGAFVLFQRGQLFWSAVLAGAASAIRITGVGAGFAFCAAVLLLTLAKRPGPGGWLRSAGLMALSGWGILFLLGYYAWRFGDPLIYSHAHGRSFSHEPSIWRIFIPDGRLLIQSLWAEPNEGVLLGAGLLWFALGHRQGLARFTPQAQAFWYVLYASIVGISMIGSVELAYGGMSRYLLTALPLFFAMAAVLKRRPAALALWLVMSTAHYWNGSLCFYVGQTHPERLKRCCFARHFRSDEL